MSSEQVIAEMRDRDVYWFRYADTTERFMPYHCFDGKLIAFKQADGGFLLRDTYWLSRHNDFAERSDTRTFTESEAREQGELTFVCNLDDVEKIDKARAIYYDDADVFDLSYQHGCYTCFALRKGAEKSAAKMLTVIAQQEEDARREIKSAEWKLERLAEYCKKVEAGEFGEVYL